MQGQCFTCGVIKAEVLRGVINSEQYLKIEALFEAFEEITMSQNLMKTVAKVAWQLDRAGKVIPLTDIIIGECARNHKAWVITEDKHFKSIPGLKVRDSLPKVSVD
jgi:predicted nucleic acid-binding protein